MIYAENAEKVFDELKIETSLIPTDEESGEAVKWIKARDNGHQINYQKMALKKDRVPNVRGMSSRDALTLLERLGVQVKLRGHGKVKRQSLLPGYRIGKTTSITLYLG